MVTCMGRIGLRDITLIVENEMEKNIEDDMEAVDM